METVEKELERLKLINSRLKDELAAEKRKKKELLAQVAQVVDLEDEIELLRRQNRELLNYWKASQEKVVPITLPKSDKPINESIDSANEVSIESSEKDHQETLLDQTEDLKERINQELSHLGIPLNSTLKKTIQAASDAIVLEAIEALKKQLSRQDITNPGGWLNKAIKESWKKAESLPQEEGKNISDKLFPDTSDSVELEPTRTLASPEILKALNKIFNKPT